MSIDLNEITLEPAISGDSVIKKQSAGAKGLLTREIKIFSSNLSDRKKENLYSELGILLSSGIDIKTSLEIYLKQQKKQKEKKLFGGIYERVIEGESLSDALKETGRFSNYEYYSLKVGEETGRQTEVLSEITRYFSQKIKQKRKLTGAMTYPLIVLLTAVVAVAFMLAFIVPLFEDVFIRFDGDLPAITKKIISLSEFLKANIFKIILAWTAFAFGLIMVKKKNWYRSASSRILLWLPHIGRITRKVYLARFCQTMSLLMTSRMPMIKSVDLVSRMIHFYPFENALQKIQERILHGVSLNEAMREYEIFDSRIVSLTRIAEEVNQLGPVYDRLARQYSEELEHQIGMLSNLLEPVMIILVGVIVAIVLVSMYLPLFQLSTSIL